jgi:hypothetical protein
MEAYYTVAGKMLHQAKCILNKSFTENISHLALIGVFPYISGALYYRVPLKSVASILLISRLIPKSAILMILPLSNKL